MVLSIGMVKIKETKIDVETKKSMERKMKDTESPCDLFAKALEQIYESLDENLHVDYEKI